MKTPTDSPVSHAGSTLTTTQFRLQQHQKTTPPNVCFQQNPQKFVFYLTIESCKLIVWTADLVCTDSRSGKILWSIAHVVWLEVGRTPLQVPRFASQDNCDSGPERSAALSRPRCGVCRACCWAATTEKPRRNPHHCTTSRSRTNFCGNTRCVSKSHQRRNAFTQWTDKTEATLQVGDELTCTSGCAARRPSQSRRTSASAAQSPRRSPAINTNVETV